jgi:hypothetical protein
MMVKGKQQKSATGSPSAPDPTLISNAIQESAQQLWQAGLGAFTRAQAESSKAAGQWGTLETIFEDRVAQAMRKLGMPTAHDIELLSHRVDMLTQAVKALSEQAASKKPAAAKTSQPAAAARRRATPRKPAE